MFGNEITLVQTGIITLVGMGTVFCVLILLVGILTLFRFIPGENSSQPVPVQNVTHTIKPISDNVSSLHKAIIISAILESLNENEQQYKVRINHIRKII